MSLSKYGSTVETTNLARLARIILGPCTDVLQDVLKKNMNPSVLSGKVKTFLAKFKKSPFTKEQEKIVYTGKYSNFDITLLYVLFRNICTFPQHSHKWGNAPNPGDMSESANIERIRLLRNKYQGHHSSISISSSDFNQEWQAIFDIVKELELYLGTCTVYQEEVKKITQCCMDPEQETKYIEQLLDLNKKLDDISVKIENTCVCKKRKELFDREVTRWKEDDKVFLETHNFPAMFNKVVDKPYVTFVGVPGSGKSVTAHHIALKLQEEGYDVLPIKDISEIETHCNPEILQVFVIDDVVGVFGLDESEFNKLCKYESIIKKPEKKETKVLMTCREVVHRNEYLTNTFLSESANVVKLHSDENLLTEQDKCNLLTMYDLDKHILSSLDLSSTSKMFPFLCKLYKKEFRNYGASFFMSPYPCILGEMDKMKQRNKIQYASLVLLMFNDSKLSESILDDDKSSKRSSCFQGKKISVLKRCKVDIETNSFRFIDALSDMKGTYTNKFDSEYTFIHDSMFEIVACHFGRQFPELMIQYMSSDYFANYIKVDGNESENRISENEESTECKASGLCIIIPESHYQMLAERLIRDIENGEMLVFGNEALKHPSVLQAFIGVMVGKSYRELYSIFLSELKAEVKYGISSLLSNIEQRNNICLRERLQDFHEKYKLLFNFRINRRESAKAISWVIFNGFHQILQYIIDRILKENGNVNDLFQNFYNKDGKERAAYDTDDDVRGAVMRASDSNIESDRDKYSEKVTVEQFRLLCLGCYSSDQTTVKTLLKHIDIENTIGTITQFTTSEVQPLFIACKFGYRDIAMELLQAGADVNVVVDSCTPMVVACGNGRLGVVKELIKAGTDINFRYMYGKQTPLTAACSQGHLDVVKQLIIKAGADVNLEDRNDTPLTAACSYGDLNVIEELIKAGADVNLKSICKTPLTIACGNGNLSLVQMIIKAGADVNLEDKNDTPLTVACSYGDLNVVEELIKAGADVNLKSRCKTPLIIACYEGHLDVVKHLINAGVDVNIEDGDDTSLTAECNDYNVIETRVDAGPVVNFQTFNKTALVVASNEGHLNVVEKLIEAGADVNLTGKYGQYTPLIAACEKNDLKTVNVLIRAGADVNLIGKCGEYTPLIVACVAGHLDVVNVFINAGVDVNLRSNDRDYTPLIAACMNNHLNLVDALTKAGADVKMTGRKNTPLAAACQGGHLKVVDVLLKCGADVNLAGETGEFTPLIAASHGGHLEVFDLLVEAGANLNCLTENGSDVY